MRTSGGSTRLLPRFTRADRLAIFVLVLLATAAPRGSAVGRVAPRQAFPEVPVTPQDLRVQPANNSPAIAVDPTEERFVVLAARLDNPDFGCTLHVSGDGGRSWEAANPVPRLPAGADKCYAPEVAFDNKGVLYYLFLGLQGRGNQPMGAFLTTSGDRAKSFTPPRRVLGPLNYMVRLAIDPTRGERGRIHLVWLKASSDPPLGGLPPSPNPILAAHSDDGGRNFSPPAPVSDRDRPRAVAPAVALGPDGSVHVVYYDLQQDVIDYQGLEGPRWRGKWSLIASSSRDGGHSFEKGVVVDDGVVPPERVLLIFTMPPPSLTADAAGNLFAAWYDGRNGDWDVFLRRSSDRGRSWRAPVRLNDDELGNGRHQYMPRLSAAPGGRLDAIFYDRRNDPQNLRNHVYFTFSDDGGESFASNRRLTSQSSDSRVGVSYPVPSARGLIEFGSRLALSSSDSGALAAWTDTRNNPDSIQQDIFATGLEFPARPLGLSWIVSAIILVLALGAVVVAVRRGRSRRRELAGDVESASPPAGAGDGAP